MKRSLACLLCVTLGAAAARADELALDGTTAFRVPVHSMKELRYLQTIHQQYDFSCGSAALATLLSYQYGYPVTETAVFEAMWAAGDQAKIRREGFSLLDMQRYLATVGFKADGFRLPLQKLVEARLPAIVLITENGYHHFVVIKGYAQDRVLLGDPSRGTRSVTLEDFLSVWPNRLLFVIHTAPTAPRFNLAADWRAAPRAPLGDASVQSNLSTASLPKFGPGDF
jgi:predicted double-glycine peptidase